MLTRTLTADEQAAFSGVLGHYHVQSNKQDPGPALQWERLLADAAALLAATPAPPPITPPPPTTQPVATTPAPPTPSEAIASPTSSPTASPTSPPPSTPPATPVPAGLPLEYRTLFLGASAVAALLLVATATLATLLWRTHRRSQPRAIELDETAFAMEDTDL